jgi:ABC-type uncharacterized transport system permease subunit
LVCVAAFVAALAVPFSSVCKRGDRWPILSCILGILIGASFGFIADALCIHAILLDHASHRRRCQD